MYQSVSGEILWAFTVLHWHQLLLHLTLHFNLNVHACKLHKMYYVGRIWCVYLWLSYCNCGLEFCAVKTALLKPEETFRIKQLICQGFTWLSNCCKSHCRRQRFILETHPNLKPELRFLPPYQADDTPGVLLRKSRRGQGFQTRLLKCYPTHHRSNTRAIPCKHNTNITLYFYIWTSTSTSLIMFSLAGRVQKLFSTLYLATRPPVCILFSLTRP